MYRIYFPGLCRGLLSLWVYFGCCSLPRLVAFSQLQNFIWRVTFRSLSCDSVFAWLDFDLNYSFCSVSNLELYLCKSSRESDSYFLLVLDVSQPRGCPKGSNKGCYYLFGFFYFAFPCIASCYLVPSSGGQDKSRLSPNASFLEAFFVLFLTNTYQKNLRRNRNYLLSNEAT